MSGSGTGVETGLALGGGAALGIAHIGVLAALRERGLDINCVAGTSAGAIAGCLFAAGMDPTEMERWVRSAPWKQLLKFHPSRRGLASISGLDPLLQDAIGASDFEQLPLPLTVVATSLLTGEPVLMRSGQLADALAASCSVPGIFNPVRYGDDLLVDGGLVANVPVAATRGMGARRVIAVDLGLGYAPAGEEPAEVFETIMTSLFIMHRASDSTHLKDADLVIAPDLAGFSPLRPDRIGERIAAGHRAALAALDEHGW